MSIKWELLKVCKKLLERIIEFCRKINYIAYKPNAAQKRIFESGSIWFSILRKNMAIGNQAGKEGVRQLVELAISCGRKHQSEQTGLIHYCYTKEDEKEHGTIPVYENLLFALALMRSKNAETIQEGKAIIEKILPFQNFLEEVGKGGFPIYLHDYPHCKDRLYGIRLLPPIYFILDQFHHVIGAALKAKLIKAAIALLEQCFHVQKEKPAPFPLDFKLAIYAIALGKFIGDVSIAEQGHSILKHIQTPRNEITFYSPAGLTEILIAMQAADLAALPDEWSSFWQFLSNTWELSSGSYIGPGINEHQLRHESQPTLYDLYMGFATGTYSYRSFIDHPFQLQGALIHLAPSLLPQSQPMEKGEIEGNPWITIQDSRAGICLFGKKGEIKHPIDKGLSLLKMLWGNRTRAHSFVCQGGNMDSISYEWHPEGYIRMEVLLGPIPNLEDREEAREVIFFTEALEDTKISVGQIQATTFNLGELVLVQCADLVLELRFFLIEGDGKLQGHIMKGNRPSQVGIRGEHRLEAFDWQIFLRTIHRSTPCRLKIELAMRSKE